MLRRKPAFQQLHHSVSNAYPVVLICRHPNEDYFPVPGDATIAGTTAWVGVCRKNHIRKLAVIQEIAVPNIARVIALYHQKGKFYAAYEYIDLDILKISPLADKEIANAFLQVLRGIQRLLFLSIGFRIDSVRVNSSGDVKIVLDWSYEPMQDQHTRTAGMPYVALFLHKIMEGLGGGHRKWSQSAAAFLGLLKAGHLPAVTYGRSQQAWEAKWPT
ncbi:hypothetical protein MHUMG1_08297 [Metarhizium humberi]|uniref:Protein kinase-like domain protein n=1 Tax=Metarhizium humberi TaxID=2596975 RepID=A0A9P8S563_9HYPO|nr:hypothetical protein MHUMG1_08297 [Metarhizium humberi]